MKKKILNLSAIESITGMLFIFRGIVLDFNDMTLPPGTYSVNILSENKPNSPSKYGLLHVLCSSDFKTITQIFNDGLNTLLVRHRHAGTAEFTEWKNLT